MVYTFDDAKAPTRHTTQYFEMTANRALYHDDWIASTTPARLAAKPSTKLGAFVFSFVVDVLRALHRGLPICNFVNRNTEWADSW